MQKENPFNITFGKEPFSIISRENELSQIYDSFESEKPNSNVYILTGIRGSGKTVSATTIVKHFKNKENWICIELNPESDMLEQLASKLYDKGQIKHLFLKKEFNFSFHGISFSIKGETPISNVSSLLDLMFSNLYKRNIHVLMTIDEVISNTYMKVFSHEFQRFLRENYNVNLIMTGLYQNISLLENQKSLTFLYRAPKIYLSELNLKSIANSYQNIFNISDKDAVILTKATGGYAYAYQLLGNILFEENKTKIDKKVLQRYDELLYENAYTILYNELSNKEKEILKYASIDNLNAYILDKTKMSKAQLSNYKKALVQKGVILQDKNKIVFRLPRFKEFIEFIKELEE